MAAEVPQLNMKTLLIKSLLLGFVLLVGTGTARAQCETLVLNAFDSGWYSAAGFNEPQNGNYACGYVSGEGLRNFFAFQVPALTQQVIAATLKVSTASITSPQGSETYELRHVSTSLPVLLSGGTGLTNVYSDLGDGAIYGSRAILVSESYQQITVPLNGAFRSNVLAASGSLFALGGAITTLAGIPFTEEYLFGYTSGSGGDAVQLILTLASTNPLAITTQPQSQTVSVTSNVTFRVETCSASPLNYQWRFNGTNLAGANGPSLSFTNVTTNRAGTYQVVISDFSGSVTSDVAVLTVLAQAPAVSVTLSGSSNSYVGQYVSLCAQVTGAPVPTVQWKHQGTNLPGETNLCLYLSPLRLDQSGDYVLVASNVVSVTTSAVVHLTVQMPPPLYVYFPSGTPNVAIGSVAYLCGVSTGPDLPNSFQWQLNGVDVPDDAMSGCLYFTVSSTNQAGFYTLIGHTLGGISYTSPPVELMVYFQAPSTPFAYVAIGSATALAGNDLTLCTTLPGSPPLGVQWRLDGVDLPGQTSECLTLLALTTNQAGNYSVVLSNRLGMATSEVLTVTVNYQPPIFASQPYSQTVIEGTTVYLNALALAGPPATHTLQFNGTNAPLAFTRANGGGFALLDVTFADAGDYQIVASNIFGVITSQVATVTVTPAGPLDRWTQRNPRPQSLPLYAVTHGQGLYVAGGVSGATLTSADGTNWFVQRRRVEGTLFGLAYGGGEFVAVGAGGVILSSSDGTNWVNRAIDPVGQYTTINAVIYGQGRFVAVSDSETPHTIVFTSTNGRDWERVAVSNVRAQAGVAYGPGRFVAVGGPGIMVSTNGLDWIVAASPVVSGFESVSFAQDQFIAVGANGALFVSPDGFAWTARSSGTTRRLLGVTYGNGRYVAAGVRGTVVTSTDAITWTPAVSGTPDRLETVIFAAGLFIAVGENGTTITSTNGTAWMTQNFGPTRDLDGMALALGKIVIVGKGGTILTSSNGADYSLQNPGVTNDLHGIAWGGGLWVAVGEPGVILTSSNAVQWTSRATGNTNSLKGVTYDAGRWVVVGTQGAILTSTNGVDWSSTVSVPAFDLNDVAYGNGLFVIVGDGPDNRNGSAFTSSNGVTWAWSYFASFGKNVRSVLFTEGSFLATANDGYLYSSFDGGSWSYLYPGGYWNQRGAVRAQGYWVIVGNNGTIQTSTNLFGWTIRPTRTFENLHDLVYLDGRFVAIGARRPRPGLR